MHIAPSKQVNKQLFDSMQPAESRQDSVNQQTDDAAPQSRAVVTAMPDRPAPAAPSYRPAVFLAHLIATRDQAPQTRERRRATPGDATAAYRAMARLAAGG